MEGRGCDCGERGRLHVDPGRDDAERPHDGKSEILLIGLIVRLQDGHPAGDGLIHELTPQLVECAVGVEGAFAKTARSVPLPVTRVDVEVNEKLLHLGKLFLLNEKLRVGTGYVGRPDLPAIDDIVRDLTILLGCENMEGVDLLSSDHGGEQGSTTDGRLHGSPSSATVTLKNIGLGCVFNGLSDVRDVPACLASNLLIGDEIVKLMHEIGFLPDEHLKVGDIVLLEFMHKPLGLRDEVGPRIVISRPDQVVPAMQEQVLAETGC